ncbi:MAG: hypothetical protein EHM23_22380 [Acidobacteria bacterium]|nr:MAG: hypothetical protein EHM23_22380 [Acidobacteriota bacterium]
MAAVMWVYWLLFGHFIPCQNYPDSQIQLGRIRLIVDEFRARVGIEERIEIAIVPDDRRLVSVCRSKEDKGVFLLSFDADFLSTLDREELYAAVAHEFGHIWIFTHRPYLQTEALANSKALVLVSEESLEKVYLKVSEFGGKRQTLSTIRAEGKERSHSRAALSPKGR